MARSLAYQPSNALNAICPYFTMFPLEYPLRVLRRHKATAPVVMDPFCGRGTTLFAARKLGLAARGIDASPVAVAVAQAKLAKIDTTAVLALASTLMKTHAAAPVPKSEFFKHAFAPGTLAAISAIRSGLLGLTRQSDASVVLRATMLGCLHGPTNGLNQSVSYFSNQMPRTFAPKPDYALRFWAQRKLVPSEAQVMQVLARKLSRFEHNDLPSDVRFANARFGDSRFASALPEWTRDFSVVVTSPPYYGMKTYVQDQWLRNWFLGGPEVIDYVNDLQLSHTGVDAFSASLGKVWRNMARSKAGELDMHIRFGIIPSCKVSAKEIVLSSLEDSGARWKVLKVRAAKTASSGKRQADQMAAGSAASVEYDFHVKRI